MGSAINFNANDVPPSVPFEPIPDGTYRAHVVASQVKPTKDSRGQYLELEFEVLEGEYKGRKFWDRLNIQNPSQQTQEIAQRQLSALCHAAGVLRISNSGQLHGLPVMAKVTIKKSEGYDPQNVVKGYKSANADTLVQTAAATPGAPTATERPGAPPWARRTG